MEQAESSSKTANIRLCADPEALETENEAWCEYGAFRERPCWSVWRVQEHSKATICKFRLPTETGLQD